MNIAGYRIEKQIGKGGMAMVYLATQESLNRPVALKVMNPLYADSAEFSERFLNEGRILASIHHSNIITIHDIGISGNFHFISMEYVQGGDLADRLKQGVSPDEAVNMVETIAACLDAAHNAHIVHRDIKPANILFRKDGHLLLTDFGIAKQLGADQNLTATGTMVGSPHYLSPEQAQGKTVDGRADIYSLGIIYYELLTGERPFTGESDVDVAIKHLTEKMPALPNHLAAHQPIIDRMTRKKADERFPGCKSLIVALQELKNTGQWSGNVAQIPITDAEVTYSAPTSPSTPSQVPPAETQTVNSAGDTLVERTLPDSEAETQPSTSASGPEAVEQTVVAPAERDKRGSVVKLTAIAASLLVVIAGTFFAVSSMMSEQYKMPTTQQPKTQPVEVKPAAKLAEDTEANDEILQQELIRQQQEQRRQEKIKNLLKIAEVAIDNYQLTTPPDTSAYFYYKEILRIDPGNQAAEKGLDTIAELYYSLARNAIEEWNYDRAKHLVDTGLSVRPKQTDLLDLKASLKKEDGKTTRSIKNTLKDVKGWFN